MTTEAPCYGLRDLEVRDSGVYLILWDNGAEDGDSVTVEVNGRVYAANMMLRNSANSIPLALNNSPEQLAFAPTNERQLLPLSSN